MTARERHGLTLHSIDSIAANTAIPYRLIYAEGGTPAWLKTALKERAAKSEIEFVDFDEPLWPNQIRKRLAPSIATDYAVFLDNDIVVTPGWLERLVSCADETGAGIVCPLYCIGLHTDPFRKIHMAGGKLDEIGDARGRVLVETHLHTDETPEAAAPFLRREPCDFAEYHCMLMRGDLARDGSVFDEAIVSVHEHIDTALSVKKTGRAIMFEPAAKMSYLGYAPQMLSDLPFFRSRWADEAAESSIAAFCAKWGVIDDQRSFGGVREFLPAHRSLTDPLRAHPTDPMLSQPMRPEELQQTPSGLIELARARGYNESELANLEQVYETAVLTSNAMYRPCGRPFVNHLTGTASVLVRYGFKVPVVAAGILHAAYTHRPIMGTGERPNAAEIAEWLGGFNKPLERRVRAYTLRSETWKLLRQHSGGLPDLNMMETEVLAIAAANEVDMHLSGEFRRSGRSDSEPDAVVALMAHACDGIGVPGLTATLMAAREALSRLAPEQKSTPVQSFRIVGTKKFPAGGTPGDLKMLTER